MSKRRARLAAATTVLALGALGGVALETNHGLPAAAQRTAAGGGTAQIVTGASGATATPASGTIAGRSSSGAHLPLVTRASGAAGVGVEVED